MPSAPGHKHGHAPVFLGPEDLGSSGTPWPTHGDWTMGLAHVLLPASEMCESLHLLLVLKPHLSAPPGKGADCSASLGRRGEASGLITALKSSRHPYLHDLCHSDPFSFLWRGRWMRSPEPIHGVCEINFHKSICPSIFIQYEQRLYSSNVSLTPTGFVRRGFSLGGRGPGLCPICDEGSALLWGCAFPPSPGLGECVRKCWQGGRWPRCL